MDNNMRKIKFGQYGAQTHKHTTATQGRTHSQNTGRNDITTRERSDTEKGKKEGHTDMSVHNETVDKRQRYVS